MNTWSRLNRIVVDGRKGNREISQQIHVRVWKSYCHLMEDHGSWFSCKDYGQNVARPMNGMNGATISVTMKKKLSTNGYVV